MHAVITIFRLLQFSISYDEIWVSNDNITRIFQYLSVLYHLVPPQFRTEASTWVMLVYILFFLTFFIIITSSSIYFKKSAKLSKTIPPLIAIFLGTFGYVFHPIALQFAFQSLYALIMKREMKFAEISIVFIILP